MNPATTGTTLTVLHVVLQHIHACIELSHIKRVLPLPMLETVPGSPPYLVGLMNLAGNTIPVIDLSMRLGVPRSKPYSIDIPILLCCDGSQQTGIVVDEVLGLIEVHESDLQMRDDLSQQDSPILAIIPVNTHLSLFLNIRRILAINLLGTEVDFTVDTTLLHKLKKHHE